jgi:acyl-coenzyme A synthetase/AMP-(fatty) acid ligase
MVELPKTISGKIKRAVLRTRELEKKMGKGGLSAGKI